MIRPLKLALSRATAPSSLKVCDCTYLAQALVRQAEARIASEFDMDRATTAMLYALAGDAMHLAAGASKSAAAAAAHRKEGEGYYAMAQRSSPVLFKEAVR